MLSKIPFGILLYLCADFNKTIMLNRVVITGLGALTPLGNNVKTSAF